MGNEQDPRVVEETYWCNHWNENKKFESECKWEDYSSLAKNPFLMESITKIFKQFCTEFIEKNATDYKQRKINKMNVATKSNFKTKVTHVKIIIRKMLCIALI